MRFQGNEAQRIINNNTIYDQARIEQGQSNPPRLIQKVTFDLGTARDLGNPFKVNFAYKSIYISEATDSQTTVDYYPNTNQTTNESFPLTKNSVLNFDYPIKNAFFTWEAQPNSTLTVIFVLDGTFRPGSLFTEVASAVEGNVFTPVSPIVATTSAQQLVAQDLTRTVINIFADSDIEISNSSAAIWFPIPGNVPVSIKNTAEFQVRTPSGTANVYVATES